MVKVIIFGLWETLGTKHFSASMVLQKHFAIPEPHFLEKYETSLHLKRWESKNKMAESFLTTFNLSVTKENLAFVSEILLRGIETATMFYGMKDVLRGLKRNFTLALLSNTTNFESEVLTKWGIQEMFDIQIYPWNINSLKPSKKSFDEVCRQLKVKPEECIFIDNEDRSINVARIYGFNVIRFEGVKDMKKNLVSFGIDI